MPTHTFPCPFCGRRMGVGTDLLGKAVRCPHCKQSLHAPDPDPSAPPAFPPAGEAPAPVFQVPAREEADSILADPEESEDEVFRTIRVPKLDLTPAPDAPTIIQRPPAAVPPGPAAADPFAGFEPAPPPAPRVVPLPAPAAPIPVGSSWDDITAAPAAVPAEEPPPARTGRGRPAAKPPDPAGPWKVAVYVLAPYALLMTVLAVYGLFLKGPDKPVAPPAPAKKATR